MGRRRHARETALQLLYALDITQRETASLLADPWAEARMLGDTHDFITVLVRGVAAEREAIDALIQSYSMHWSLDRIGLVERNILRFAIFELLFLPDIPANVTINEAVEVAKKYGTEEAPAFINGILDRIKQTAVPQDEHSAVGMSSSSV